jgi:hypothetical protein
VSSTNADAGTRSGLEVPFEISTYTPTDGFFGAPFVDCDEVRTAPVVHRYVHGGFDGTDTRFLFCFPPQEMYRGRMLQPLGGGNAGDEGVNYNPHGAMITGGIEMIFRLGGYAVESNMGHIGDVPDPAAGDDPTIYGWRAAAESARFSKFLAEQILGRAPAHSYVYGGSGGARRSPLCLAYAPDVWDGALPFMGDANDGDHGDFARIHHSAGNFALCSTSAACSGTRSTMSSTPRGRAAAVTRSPPSTRTSVRSSPRSTGSGTHAAPSS